LVRVKRGVVLIDLGDRSPQGFGTSFHLRRDSQWSIAYSEELISSTISVTLQSTDRHDGIVG
jgi:hypothetical protein